MTTHTTSLVGEPIHLKEETLAALPTVERSIAIRCATGTRPTAVWRGKPVSALVDAADIPPETTHLCFEDDNGYRVSLDIRSVLDGVLAVARDGIPLDAPERPRLVCPGIEGARTVKGVLKVTPLSLSENEDPERLEALDRRRETDA